MYPLSYSDRSSWSDRDSGVAVPSPSPRQLLDIEAAAAYLTVAPGYVRRLVRERRIAFIKVGKFVRFDPKDLDAYIDKGRVEVGSSVESRHVR